VSSVVAPTDTITALTDLISGYAGSEIPDSALEMPFGSGVIEERPDPDAFEPAQPGEDLLIPATPQETAIAHFEIGEDTLQQLTADLYSLERPNAAFNLENDKPLQSANFGDHLSVDPLADLLSGESFKTASEGAIDSQTGAHPPEHSISQISSHADQIANAITLEDLLFKDGVDSLVPDLTQSPEHPPEQSSADAQSVSVETAATLASNAFTLEGLDTLFEGLPSTSPHFEVLHPETPASNRSISEWQPSEEQPKKKV